MRIEAIRLFEFFNEGFIDNTILRRRPRRGISSLPIGTGHALARIPVYGHVGKLCVDSVKAILHLISRDRVLFVTHVLGQIDGEVFNRLVSVLTHAEYIVALFELIALETVRVCVRIVVRSDIVRVYFNLDRTGRRSLF